MYKPWVLRLVAKAHLRLQPHDFQWQFLSTPPLHNQFDKVQIIQLKLWEVDTKDQTHSHLRTPTARSRFKVDVSSCIVISTSPLFNQLVEIMTKIIMNSTRRALQKLVSQVLYWPCQREWLLKQIGPWGLCIEDSRMQRLIDKVWRLIDNFASWHRTWKVIYQDGQRSECQTPGQNWNLRRSWGWRQPWWCTR